MPNKTSVLVVMAAVFASASFARSQDAGVAQSSDGADTSEIVVDDEEPTAVVDNEEPWLLTAVTGFLDSRWFYNRILVGRLQPSDDVPTWLSRNEGNFQLKLKWRSYAQWLSDVSFYYQKGWNFYARSDAPKGKQEIATHDVVALRPQVLLHELYVAADVTDHLNLTLGKKRIVWGSGSFANPTDLINPPKDAADPSNQRVGAYLARAELPFESFTLSAVGALGVLEERNGIPTSLGRYPDYPSYEATRAPLTFVDQRDRDTHYLLSGRGYFLVADTDINFIYYFSNRYQDAFRHKSRVGVSVARYFWNKVELHGEVLGQQGSDKLFVNSGCVRSMDAAFGCVLSGRNFAERNELEDGSVHVKLLLGGRYNFDDESMFTIEYLWFSDGYNRREFRDYLTLVAGLRALSDAGFTPPAILTSSEANTGAPRNFQFTPLLRHYVAASYMRPRIADDFTFNALVLLGLHDFSGTFVPALSWAAREWLTLGLTAFLPIAGIHDRRTKVVAQQATLPGPGGTSVTAQIDERRYSEFGIGPVDWRIFLNARAYY